MLKDIMDSFSNGGDKAYFAARTECSDEYASNDIYFAISANMEAADGLEKLGQYLKDELKPLGITGFDMEIPAGISIAPFSYAPCKEDEEMSMRLIEDTIENANSGIMDKPQSQPASDNGSIEIKIWENYFQCRMFSKYSNDIYTCDIGYQEFRDLMEEALKTKNAPSM